MTKASHKIHLTPTLLNDPIHDKGTAFTEDERKSLGLEGLLIADWPGSKNLKRWAP